MKCKKLLSILLCLCLAAGLLPGAALAGDPSYPITYVMNAEDACYSRIGYTVTASFSYVYEVDGVSCNNMYMEPDGDEWVFTFTENQETLCFEVYAYYEYEGEEGPMREDYRYSSTDVSSTGSGTVEMYLDGDPDISPEFELHYTCTYYAGNPDSYTSEDTVTLEEPTRPYHTFSGWYDNPELAGLPVTGIPAGSTGERTFYAAWDPNIYTLSFETYGGTPIDPIVQAYGTAVAAPADPTRNGYTFRGWNSPIPAAMPGEDEEFYAYWDPIRYAIHYDLNGGTLENVGWTVDLSWNSDAWSYADVFTVYVEWDGRDADCSGNSASLVLQEVPWDDVCLNVTVEEVVPAVDADSMEEYYYHEYSGTVPAAEFRNGGVVEMTDNDSGQTFSLTWTAAPGGARNPDSYTVEDWIYIPYAPVRAGCRFLGWTWEGRTTPEEDVNIPDGATGDLTFTANWRALSDWEKLQILLDEAESGDTVRLTQDYAAVEEDEGLRIADEKSVTLDLNGHTLSCTGMRAYAPLTVCGTLILTDGSGSGSGQLSCVDCEYAIDVQDNGSLEMAGGAVSLTDGVDAVNVCGSFSMSGGSVIGENCDDAVYLSSDTACFTMTGGTVSGSDLEFSAVYMGSGTFRVSGAPAADVYLYDENVITVADILTEDASIRVHLGTTISRDVPRVITVGLANGGEYGASAFRFAGTGAALEERGGELALVKQSSPWDELADLLAGESSTVILEKDYTTNDVDGDLVVPDGRTVTLDLNGHRIEGVESKAYQVLQVLGSLTLTDSSESGSGEIVGSSFDSVVYVPDTGSFTMTGGTVSGSECSAVVCVAKGSFTMTGGTVSGSECGRTVYVNTGSFTLSGGAVADCSERGAAVYVDNGGFFLSGAPEIDSIYLKEGCFITLTDALALPAPAAVEKSMNGTFTQGWNTYMKEADPAAYFQKKYEEFILEPDEAGELRLLQTAVSYLDENGLEQQCTAYKVIREEDFDQDGCAYYWEPGWYVLKENVTGNELSFNEGDCHLILCDGASLELTRCLCCYSSLSIYGQTLGTGALCVGSEAAPSRDPNHGVFICSLTVNGGRLSVWCSTTAVKVCEGNYIQNGGTVAAWGTEGLSVQEGSLFLNGGSAEFTATRYSAVYVDEDIFVNGGNIRAIRTEDAPGSDAAVYARAITLGWTAPEDSLCFGSVNGSVVLVRGFLCGTELCTGEYDIENFNSLMGGKTLTPVTETVLLSSSAEDADHSGVTVGHVDLLPEYETLYVGDRVTLSAQAPGWTFLGWYDDDELLCSSLEYSFFILKDTAITALYRSNRSVEVTVNCEGSFAVDGEDKADRYEAEYRLGSRVTLETAEADFAYWANDYGKVLSTEPAFSFTVTGKAEITAVFNTAEEDRATLVFRSLYDQIMARDRKAEGETMEVPVIPVKNGCIPVGWDYDGDGTADDPDTLIREAIAFGLGLEDRTVVILPVYTLKDAAYEILVTEGILADGSSSGSYSQNQLVTVTALEPPYECRFSYWQDGDGRILSYNERYTFFADRNLELTAVYVEEEEEVEAVGTTVLIDAYVNGDTRRLTFVSLSTVPENCTMDLAGIIATMDDTVGNSGDDFTAESDNVRIRGDAWSGVTYRYTWTVGGLAPGQTVYVRPYLVYTDTDGNRQTVYGDMFSMDAPGD